MRRTLSLALAVAASVAVLSAQGQQPGSSQPGSQAARPAQQPARDTPAQPNTAWPASWNIRLAWSMTRKPVVFGAA